MGDTVSIGIEDGVGILTIDYPPVNALSQAVRAGLDRGIDTLAADPAVKAIVIICAGRTFIAGADITEFGKGHAAPTLHHVLDKIENSPKPVIAAIHGTALGGGFETSLVCHFRVAVPSAKVGLPEVHLGLLPGAGGTQRLPRIVGVAAALDLITSGRPVGARQALAIGLIDALAEEGRLREDAIAFARQEIAAGRPLTRVRDRDDKVAEARGKPEIFADFRANNARQFRGFKAPEAIIKAIEAAVELPIDQGLAREVELFIELESSTESRAQRHVFFAERETSKVPGISGATAKLPIETVGIIGAGTMGGGIAMNFLNVGMPVTLVETSQAALDRGLATIRRTYEATAAKGRMTQDQVEERMALIRPTLDKAALGEADLVIEAVFERMALKKEVFAELDAIAKPGAILATNTSYLDVDEIASATSRPESVIGLHFFSPANVMRLLEVVRGEHCATEVVATAMALAKRIGKVPVLSGVCDGFIANRIMARRSEQADALILEGVSPADIDRAIYDFGFPMGPFQMWDLVGLDVVREDGKTVRGELVKLDRLGQKKNGGYYDYDAQRRPTPSPVATDIIAAIASEQGIARRAQPDAGEIVARLLFPVVNEGAKLLEEGIALRASDIDMAAILGYGWPVYTGGPMFWADTVGLPKILEELRAYQRQYGDAFKPAALIEQLVAQGRGFTGQGTAQ